MNELEGLVRVGIYALMGISVLWAIGVVAFKKLFHAALALGGVLVGVAGIYISLHAEFLAVIQIFVYVGAVATLIIFSIMLTEKYNDETIAQHNKQSVLALLSVASFAFILIHVIKQTPWPGKLLTVGEPISILDIGTALLTTYVFPFEVIAIILTGALIGAVIVAKKEKD